MKLVTAASRRRLPLLLLQRCAAASFEFTALGSDRQWTSFQPKLACIHDFSKNEIASGRGDEPFVFVDAFDVIMANCDPRHYASLYRGKPLFAAEMYNWPDKTLKYPEKNLSYRQSYLNSGCFIATPRDMYRLLADNEFRNYTDDQLYWAHVYVKNPDRIDLDFDSRLCACLVAYISDPHALRIHDSELVFLQTFKNPPILHFNGPAVIKRRMWRWYLYFELKAVMTGMHRIANFFRRR
jgi:hypothetical protein